MIASLWNRFWFGQSSGRSEAFFRAAFSLVLLCDVLGMSSKVSLLFSNQGVHPVTPIDMFYGVSTVTALHKLWILILLGLVLGIRTRILGWLNFAMSTYFLSLRGYAALHVADWVYQSMSFCMALMTTDCFLSIERGRGSSDAPAESVSNWPRRIAQLNLASIYFHSGTTKLADTAWLQGTALTETLRISLFCNFDLTHLLSRITSILIAANYAVIIWELCVPFFWLSRKTRRWALLSSLLFHTGILILLRVGWFTEAMFACLLLFIDDLSTSTNDPCKPPRFLSLSFKRMATHGFIFFHLIVFSLSNLAFAGRTLAPGAAWWQFHHNLPFPVQFYANHIARMVYFNVWPSPFFFRPLRVIRYRGINEDGTPSDIPPFDDHGNLKNDLSHFKEARAGLLGIRIAKFGLTQEQWDALLQYIVRQHQKKHAGRCPARIEIWRIEMDPVKPRSDDDSLTAATQNILSADVVCSETSYRFDLQFASAAQYLLTGPQYTWYKNNNVREWLRGLNAYYGIGV